MNITRFAISILLSALLAIQPALAAFTPTNPNGQALGANSQPVTLSAPNTVTASPFTSPHAASAYTAGQAIANSATAGSVVPMAFAIAPANGVPVYVLGGKVITQTSGSAGPAITNGTFRLHLYGQSPTVAGGDGATFSTTMVNWCGVMEGTLQYVGTDYSVAVLFPSFLSFITCTPAGGSQTIYGLLQAGAAWAPATSNSIYQISITAQ